MSKKNEKTIAEKIAALDDLVAWFESDDFELEQALDRFADAEALAKDLENDLSTVKNKITLIKKEFSKDDTA